MPWPTAQAALILLSTVNCSPAIWREHLRPALGRLATLRAESRGPLDQNLLLSAEGLGPVVDAAATEIGRRDKKYSPGELFPPEARRSAVRQLGDLFERDWKAGRLYGLVEK